MKLRKLALALGAGVLAVNLVAFAHAWRFTHFVGGGERTAAPESLGLGERVAVALTGVRVPRPTLTRRPPDVGLDAADVRHGALATWATESGAPARVALFHGYGASKSDLLDAALAFRDEGLDLVLVDFPGSGDSAGDVTTLGWHEAAAVRDVAAVHADRPLVLYGASMGAAAVLRAVSELGVRPACVVLESPFDRLVTTVGHRFEAMGLPAWPGAWLLVAWGGVQHGFDGFAHDPSRYARRVDAPALLLHGDADPRVTVAEAEAVRAALAGPGRLVLFPGAGHETLVRADPARWRGAVREHLAGCLPPPA